MEAFDAYKDTYRDDVESVVSFSGLGLDFFTRVKVDALLDAVSRHVGEPAEVSVLDVGCGPGETDRFLKASVGSLHGADVAPELLERARLENPDVEYRQTDGTRLPWQDDSHDVAFAINVMHHVPPSEWPTFAREMTRVVRPGGLVAVFEHNPFNPLTRRVVRQCIFDEHAVLLRSRQVRDLLAGSGAPVAEHRYILFLPLDRPWARAADRRLAKAPLGAQYYVAGKVT